MSRLLSTLIWHRGGVADEQWCPEFYRRLAAVRAFRRARRAALFRRFAGLCGRALSRDGGCGPEHIGDTADIPIRRIVGVRNPDGSLCHSLAPSRGTSREAWLRRYLAAEAVEYPPLRVYRDGASYYLDGGGSALIALEVMWAKGLSRVRAIVAGSLERPASASRTESPRSSGGAPDGCREVRPPGCTAA
jgi:hypothetical protein